MVAETLEQARDAAFAARPVLLDQSDRATLKVGPKDYSSPFFKQSVQGDLAAAMQEAAFTVDDHYLTPSMSHAAMEPHAATAWWDGDKLTVRGSYQMLRSNAAELADALGVSADKVRILSPYVGGGFGGKLGIGHEAVGAAIAAGCKPHLVCTGRAAHASADELAQWRVDYPGAQIHDHLAAFAEHLLRRDPAAAFSRA